MRGGELDLSALKRIEGVYRLLGDEDARRLAGSDLEYARWLAENDGLIGFSVIRREGDRVHVLSGPMKHFGKSIVRFDMHTRNALVRLRFLENEADIWLAFVFEDEGTGEEMK